MDNNRVDFEKLRKKRQRTQTVRRLLILVGVMVVIAGVVILNNVLIDTGFSTRVSDVIGAFGGSGYPVEVPGGVIRSVGAMGNDLAVLNDTNLYIYSNKGKVMTNLQQMTSQTVMIPASSRVLTYDVGGRSYEINSRSRQLQSKTADNGILCADMNDRGDYVLATTARQYVSQVSVYNKNAEEIFRWLSAENIVADVSINPKGDRLAVAAVNTEQGIIHTYLYVFDISSEQEVFRQDYSGEFLLDLSFDDDGSIRLLTDVSCMRISDTGTGLFSYDLGGLQPSAYERHGRNTLLLLRHREGRSQQVVVIGSDGKELCSFSPPEQVRDIAMADRQFYLLCDTGIYAYDLSGDETGYHSERGIQLVRCVKNRLYYVTQEAICIL